MRKNISANACNKIQKIIFTLYQVSHGNLLNPGVATCLSMLSINWKPVKHMFDIMINNRKYENEYCY